MIKFSTKSALLFVLAAGCMMQPQHVSAMNYVNAGIEVLKKNKNLALGGLGITTVIGASAYFFTKTNNTDKTKETDNKPKASDTAIETIKALIDASIDLENKLKDNSMVHVTKDGDEIETMSYVVEGYSIKKLEDISAAIKEVLTKLDEKTRFEVLTYNYPLAVGQYLVEYATTKGSTLAEKLKLVFDVYSVPVAAQTLKSLMLDAITNNGLTALFASYYSKQDPFDTAATFVMKLNNDKKLASVLQYNEKQDEFFNKQHALYSYIKGMHSTHGPKLIKAQKLMVTIYKLAKIDLPKSK